MTGLEALNYADELTYSHYEVDDLDIIEKELKALEIIKNKGVCLPALKLTASFEKDNLEEYNKMCVKHYALPLTQEEYDLLKEVLLNEKC